MMNNIPKFNTEKLITLMLDQPWHKQCSIIPDYVRKIYKDKPNEEQHQIVCIKYNDNTEYPPFLRYSQGPKQGFFWDIYGDNFISVELAIIALSQAPTPVNVNPIVVKFSAEKLKTYHQ